MGDAWIEELLGSDPVPWVLGSDEPFARWSALTGVLGKDMRDADVEDARRELLADPRVDLLVADLPSWGTTDVPGHHSPLFLPNRLNLLADMGILWGDRPRVDSLLDEMLAHQDRDGRFQTRGKFPGRPKPEWGSLACDTNAITDVLLRFGRSGRRVDAALARMTEDLQGTPQGDGWRCIPERRTLFRGPGRKADVCPQVTLEGLRAFSQLPPEHRPRRLLESARTPLEIWRRRTEERPYQFGHGYQFKSVKWPNFWYDVLWVLETVGRFPELWRTPDAAEEDRRAIAELAACLVAYNFGDDGRVVPRRTYRGFEAFSFGQKREPSPFATARCLVALARVADLAEEIRAVDVEALPSSKGGSGTPVPPSRSTARRAPAEPEPCPVPRPTPSFAMHEAMGRVLVRHHLGTPWAPATPESLTADIVGLHAEDVRSPYLSLAARQPGFASEQLDAALYERRSLVRFRCMRGVPFVVRREMLSVVAAATGEQVIAYARRFAGVRGVTPGVYGGLAPRVFEALQDETLTVKELRSRLTASRPLQPGVDLAAMVSLMTAEGLLLQERPRGGRGHEATYGTLSTLLPDVRLDSLRRPDADVRLVREYVRAFAPVVPRDIMWWTGIGRKRVRHALETLGDEVAAIRIHDVLPPERGMAAATFEHALDGVWLVHSADLDELGSTAPTDSPQVALLPPFDPLLMGYGRKGRFVSEETRPYVFDAAGNVTSAVLVDGRVAGVWGTRAEPEPAVMLHLFPSSDDAAVEAIRGAAADLGRFLYSADTPVVDVARMLPLAKRAAGAVRKPL